MTPELQELIGLRFVVLMTASVLLCLTVSFLRVRRERSAQAHAGLPLTTTAEMWTDALYGTLAAIAVLLLQDSIKPLPIKAAIALAMVYGSIGPALWDLAAGVVSGKYGISLTRKGGQDDGR